MNDLFPPSTAKSAVRCLRQGCGGQASRCSLGLGGATDLTTTVALRTAKRLQVICRFLNDLPTFAQMFFRGEHVAEADPHYCSAAQFCLREIHAPGRVDLLYDVAVDLISGAGASSRRCALARRGRRSSNKAKTDYAHAGLRGQLKAIVIFDPVCEQVRQTNLFAQPGNHSGPA